MFDRRTHKRRFSSHYSCANVPQNVNRYTWKRMRHSGLCVLQWHIFYKYLSIILLLVILFIIVDIFFSVVFICIRIKIRFQYIKWEKRQAYQTNAKYLCSPNYYIVTAIFYVDSDLFIYFGSLIFNFLQLFLNDASEVSVKYLRCERIYSAIWI